MHLLRSTLFLLITAKDLVEGSSGYDLQGPIQGCSEVDCPYDGTCNIQGDSFKQLGVTNFTTNLSSDPLNWVIAGRPYYTGPEQTMSQQAFEKQFFIGTPSDFDLGANWLSGCSLFFSHEKLSFPSNDEETSTGTCADVLGSDCVEALEGQATNIVRSMNISSMLIEEACEMLQNTFSNQTIAQECQTSEQTQWTNVQVAELTGGHESSVIQKDAGIDCHPTSPDNNQLRHVYGYNITSLSLHNPGLSTHIVVPVMTVFFGKYSSNHSKSVTPEAYLSCLKPTGFSEAELSSMSVRLSSLASTLRDAL